MLAASFDLETTSLNGNFGIILCGSVKPFPPPGIKTKIITFRGDDDKKWKTNRSDDSYVAKALYEHLQKYDIWVAHNGVRFDVPFLRTRLMKCGIMMPQPKIVDPVRLARRYLKLGYNNLKQVAGHFSIYGKTEVTGDHWMQAALDGNKKSMDYIVEHCEADVVLLERVAKKLSHLVPKVNQFGSD